MILEGRVRINGSIAAKAGTPVQGKAEVSVDQPRRFVSRGGEKLEAALQRFAIDVNGKRALDVGASSGGFTDCLLQRGAASVTAVDVGYGQFDWRLRNDPRVTMLERSNYRTLPKGAFATPFDVIVVDVSFISLKLILPRAVKDLAQLGDIVALIKPQFEAGRTQVGKGGVVRDPQVHRAVLREVRDAMGSLQLYAVDGCASPLLGPAGNREFFLRFRMDGGMIADSAIDGMVERQSS